MRTIDERFRTLRHLRAPDVWEEVERRRAAPQPAEGPWRRLAVAAVALVLAAGGIALAIRSFSGDRAPRPGASVGNGNIAFAVDSEDGDQIWVIGPDGGEPRMVVEGRTPAWSPDGARIAFRRGNPQRGGGLETSIFVSDADGTDVTPFAPETYGEASGEGGAPVWSPDGHLLAFDTLGGIYVARPDGTGLRRVTRYEGEHACYDLEPSWSPDGTRLVFAVLCDGGNEGIWAVNLDGSGREQLLAPSRELLELYSPAWSPDGARIAFAAASPGGDYWTGDIYVMRADGTGVTRLTDRGGVLGTPAWSPDGRMIAFSDTSDEAVFVMNADGTELRRLTDPSLRACCPAWQPLPSTGT